MVVVVLVVVMVVAKWSTGFFKYSWAIFTDCYYIRLFSNRLCSYIDISIVLGFQKVWHIIALISSVCVSVWMIFFLFFRLVDLRITRFQRAVSSNFSLFSFPFVRCAVLGSPCTRSLFYCLTLRRLLFKPFSFFIIIIILSLVNSRNYIHLSWYSW